MGNIASKYRVGDRVIVRSDLQLGSEYGHLLVVDPMGVYRGKILTISDVHDLEIEDGYAYYVKECGFHWSNQMFVRKIYSKATDEELCRIISTSNSFLDRMG